MYIHMYVVVAVVVVVVPVRVTLLTTVVFLTAAVFGVLSVSVYVPVPSPTPAIRPAPIPSRYVLYKQHQECELSRAFYRGSYRQRTAQPACGSLASFDPFDHLTHPSIHSFTQSLSWYVLSICLRGRQSPLFMRNSVDRFR